MKKNNRLFTEVIWLYWLQFVDAEHIYKKKHSKTDCDKEKDKDEKVDACAVGPKKCDRPDDKRVDWVYCEGCPKGEGWFHCPCVNVDSNLAKNEDYEFLCNPCTTKQNVENDNEFEEEEVNLIISKHFIKVHIFCRYSYTS